MHKQGETLSEKETKENFLVATELTYRELTRKYDASKGESTIDDLKTFLINEERQKEAEERAFEWQLLNSEIKEDPIPKRGKFISRAPRGG